jgi:hypothetical protein
MGNILNLVFDKWDGDMPISNLLFLNKKLGREALPDTKIDTPSHFFTNLGNDLINNNYKKNYCKLADVSLNENYYYIILHYCSYDNLFNENEWQISEEVEYYIKHKNLKVIFLSEHESYMDLNIDIQKLTDLIDKKELNPKQFYVINNNSLIDDIKNNTLINLYKSNFLLEKSSISLVENEYKIPFIENKPFLFLCLNRRPKTHRIALLTLLKNNELLDSGLIDWSLTYGLMNHPLLSSYGQQHFIDGSNDKKLLNSYYQICSKPKLSFYETDKDWFNNPDNYAHFMHIESKSYENSYINIITESHYEIKDIHITEKSYKPFYFYQFPIFLASYRHVEMFKKEHPDLDLFEDIINYDYDLEIDDKKRLHMVLNEIIRLSKLEKKIKSYYINNKDRFIKNYEYVSTYYLKNEKYKYFYNLSNKLKKLI